MSKAVPTGRMSKAVITKVVLAATAALALVGPPAALARVRPEPTYHPTFTRVPGTELLSGEGDVAIADPASIPWQVRLIDRTTGHAQTITEPGCEPAAVGGGWLAMMCGAPASPSYTLYDIAQQRTLPFTPAPFLTVGECGTGCPGITGIAAVGADWLAMTNPCEDPSKCVLSFSFQNLSEGTLSADPTNRTTRIDLDAPGLAQPVCAPLTVPVDNVELEGEVVYPGGWGSLTLDGDWGIAAGNEGVYLQRCGSRTRTFLTRTPASGPCASRACSPTNDRSMVVWEAAAGRLGGIFLNGLRRFQISVPAKVDPFASQLRFALSDQYTLALVGKTLYLETPMDGIWEAKLAAAPR